MFHHLSKSCRPHKPTVHNHCCRLLGVYPTAAFLGFLVPYLLLLVCLLVTPPYIINTVSHISPSYPPTGGFHSFRCEKIYTYQIQRSTDEMIPHTGTILTTSSAHQHHAVLLDVVALAGDIGGDRTSGRQPHTGGLALARVGLLGPRDADLEADSLPLRGKDLGQGGGDGVAGSLGFPAALLTRLFQLANASCWCVRLCETGDIRGGLG
jgi:hypothetical protein